MTYVYTRKYRVWCTGGRPYEIRDGRTHYLEPIPGCGWTGVRTDRPDDCACYDEYAAACSPTMPGPGCTRGVIYPCPLCGGDVVARPVNHRPRGALPGGEP